LKSDQEFKAKDSGSSQAAGREAASLIEQETPACDRSCR